MLLSLCIGYKNAATISQHNCNGDKNAATVSQYNCNGGKDAVKFHSIIVTVTKTLWDFTV